LRIRLLPDPQLVPASGGRRKGSVVGRREGVQWEEREEEEEEETTSRWQRCKAMKVMGNLMRIHVRAREEGEEHGGGGGPLTGEE
jgi:hypothetical protein